VPDILRPRRLNPGDTVAIAAPSGPFIESRRHELDAAVAELEAMGFRVRLSALVESASRTFWRSAPPEDQAAELNALLADPDVRAIVAFTGGNAATGYLDRLDYSAVLADPKPILGFSDITAIHLAVHSRTGLVGFHGDMAAVGFGSTWRDASPERRAVLRELYTGLLTGAVDHVALPAERVWETWRPGRAEGRLIGGIMDRFVRLQASPLALAPERFDGAILFWEEVGRNLGHIWNDLHVLRMSGVLDRIAGMAVGPLAHIAMPPDHYGPVTVKDVVLDVLGDRGIPVLGNVDFGHTGPNLPMPIGVRAALDADARGLTLLESPVA
jgi:muramoyltetrapeptide carboxypeptidase